MRHGMPAIKINKLNSIIELSFLFISGTGNVKGLVKTCFFAVFV